MDVVQDGRGVGVSGSDSQVSTPLDDPRLGLTDAQLAPAAVQTRSSDQNQTSTTRLVGEEESTAPDPTQSPH